MASGATFTADFNTVNLTADHVVTIDAPFTIGTLISRDTVLPAAPAVGNSWTFAGPGPLTLDNGVSQPVLNIGNRVPTISAPLAGTNGFSKIGQGQVTLSGNNTLTGVMDLADVTGTNGAGVVLASNTAIGGITTINVKGTAASSGQFLGLSGGVTLGSGVTINLSSQGGNSAPAGGIRGEGAGSVNTINGPINITQNATRIANNGAARLDINGVITGGANQVTFRFGNNQGIHLTNTGNSWSGNTVHSEGTLWFEPGTIPATSNIQLAVSNPGTIQTSGSFTRALGTGANQLQFTLSAGRPMGISARGGDLNVNFGGAAAEVFFDTTAGAAASTIRTNTLVLNNATSTHKLTLANPLNLNGGARTLQIDANTVELPSPVNGGNFALSKTGGGTLLLPTANTWLGDFNVNAGDSNSAGIVRATHAEAFGPTGAVKNINIAGLNRATSLIELDGGIAIDASKSLRMSGKSYIATGGTAIGVQQSLRSVSGNNAWHGNVIIAATGGAYGIESVAGTLTLGSDPATTSVLRNEISADRPMFLFGGGNYVLNTRVADNALLNTGINKVGTGSLSITRADNDFDLVPNLYNGLTEIVSLTDGGLPSSLGTAASLTLGGTLRYTGAGDSSNRTLGVFQTGATLDASGSGPLQLTAPAFTHQAGVTATIAVPFALGASTLILNDASMIAVGQTVTGTGIAAGTTVAAVDVNARALTLSQPTSAASTVGVALTIGAAANLDRTLTLAGSNTGNNTFEAALNNPAGTGKLGVSKTGPGTWILGGASQTYTGPTQISEGTLGFDGAFPAGSVLTMNPAATLSLANLQLRVDPGTGRALDIDGNLSIDGPVNIVLNDAAPSGSYTVLEFASISGIANLTTNYRESSFAPGAGSATVTVAPGSGVPLIWTGSIDSTWTTLGGNWKTTGNVPESFYWGDSVRFDDSGAIAPTVDLVGELRPGSMLIDADTVEYFLQGSGTLSGPFALTKAGSAIATIGGVHSFTGGVFVQEGILRPQGNQSLGGNGNVITVASGATLDTNGSMTANRDYEAVIAGTGTDGSGAIINSGATHNNGFRSLTLSADATIGGAGRWDVRPITAGTAFVDLAGFTLTKTGANYIGLVDGSATEAGSINVNEGTLGITRTVLSGDGSINVSNGAQLLFENNTTGSCDKAISLNDASLRLQGSNYTLASAIAATGSATLDVEAARTLTVTGAVSGSGNLVKSANTGALTLTATNTYLGTTLINAGTLTIGSQATLGTLGEGAVTNNGALVINRPDTDYVFDNAMDGTGTLTVGQGTGGSFTSLVTVTGANTFTGNVAVASGGMKIFNAGALGTGVKTIFLTNGTAGRPQFYLDGSGGNITLPVDVSFNTSSTNPNQPAIGNLGGDNVIEGNITVTSGGGSTAISVFGGSLALNGGIAPDTSARRLILGGTAGTGAVNGVISGTGGNAMGLDKVGDTVWTLTGTNTYTGTTAVTGGVLLVNGNQGLASGAVSVGTGATLGGIGTIGGSIAAQSGSVVAPGVTIGTLTTTAPVTLSGSLAVELDAASSDRLTVGGSLNLSGASLDITALAAASQPAYVIASYGVLSGTFSSVTGLPAGYGINYNYNGLKQIALVAGGNAYGNFETVNGISGAGSATDSDNDGIPNGIEFVIGGIPSGPGSDSSGLLPTVSVDGAYLNFVFRRSDESASYDPFVEYGSSLTGWTAAEGGVNGVIVNETDDGFDDGIDSVEVRIPRTLAVGTRLFARLRVDIP